VHLRIMKRPRLTGLLFGALACVLLAASSCEDTEWRQARPPIVRGIAEFHGHQFGLLGFARQIHTHSTDPTALCSRPLSYNDSSLRVRDMVRAGLLAEATAQADRGLCAPTASNLAGQQYDDSSLFRAYQYGLRLMVMFAVNSEFLCVNLGGTLEECRDMPNLDRQLKAAHDMQERVDAAAGGPGMGWYQIVLTPDHAREVISQGKLAVVLGIEASGPFDCGIMPGPKVLSANILVDPPEQSYVSGICDESGIANLNTSRALARMEHYWDLGVRHFFPIHTFDSVIGGTALSNDLLHADYNPSGMSAGNVFDTIEHVNRVIKAVRPGFTTFNCSNMDFDELIPELPGKCNALGLTNAGNALIEHLASYGAVIDIDHMSLLAKTATTTEILGAQYPVASSHTGIQAINHGHKRNEGQLTDSQLELLAAWDGAIGPILRPGNTIEDIDTWPPDTPPRHTCGGTSESFIQTYRYVTEKIASTPSEIGALYQPEERRFVGVGFGSDFNGLAGWPVGRFWGTNVSAVAGPAIKLAWIGPAKDTPHPCVGGFDPSRDSPQQQRAVYPIVSPLTQIQFDKSSLPWTGSSAAYDIANAGFAHIGMLPDFMAELQALGLSEDQLDPMWLGAEAYLRMWGHAASWGTNGGYGTEVQKGIRTDCRLQRARLIVGDTGIPTPERIQDWSAAMSELQRLGCDGTSASTSGSTTTPPNCDELLAREKQLATDIASLQADLSTAAPSAKAAIAEAIAEKQDDLTEIRQQLVGCRT